MITGFRWSAHGAQALYGVRPDLSCWGKAMGNGFPVSALAGKREFMELGGYGQTVNECSYFPPHMAPRPARSPHSAQWSRPTQPTIRSARWKALGGCCFRVPKRRFAKRA